jgi:hypothetical protein
MLAVLFRNPVARLLVGIWGKLLAAFILIGWLTGLVAELGVSLAVFAIATGSIFVVDRLLYLGKAMGRHLAGHRFLCPECLRFGPFCFACADCGEEVPPLVVDGYCACECTSNRLEPPRHRKSPPRFEALCMHCQARSDRALYHHRRVRVVGTLFRDDPARLCGALDIGDPGKASSICVCDDGTRLTYVVPLDALPDGAPPLPLDHALRALEAIWINDAERPLALGQLIDRFLRRSGLTETERKRITILVRQTALPPAGAHLLATRFGALQCGKEPRALLSAGAFGRETTFLRYAELAPGPPADEWSSPDSSELFERAARRLAADRAEQRRYPGRYGNRQPGPRGDGTGPNQNRH